MLCCKTLCKRSYKHGDYVIPSLYPENINVERLVFLREILHSNIEITAIIIIIIIIIIIADISDN
jgi:hypothetical protein